MSVGFELLAKRAIDVLLALVILVLLSPALAFIALSIWIESGRPILYRSTRYGRSGRVFTMRKFRTMIQNADQHLPGLLAENRAHGNQVKIPNDPRVTRVGRVLRRTSLDELPNLLNVLRGEMSLVGPRPHTLQEYPSVTPALGSRLRMRPGMTGLWQVMARNHPSEAVRALWDLRYIANWSFALDLRIVLRTLPAVLRLDGGRLQEDIELEEAAFEPALVEKDQTGA